MNSRFRNGIFFLATILVSVTGIYYLYANTVSSEPVFFELKSFQEQVDSLKLKQEQEYKAYAVKPFNPNFISEYKAYVLGISTEELDRIYKYRKEGKWINTISDFQKVSKVSDSLLNAISPLFKFPEWIQNKSKHTKFIDKKNSQKTYAAKKDLNVVTEDELRQIVNIPEFIAKRIISYRNQLGGFVDDIQLQDVNGLYDYKRIEILSNFTVKTPQKISKININKASVEDLVEIPYFEFETVLEIKAFVDTNGPISDFKELGKIDGFSLEKIDRIKLYLTLK
ncbi:ComEA family DNA-binding protein [Aquimarina algicola]|nr:helix-hairpin-helix domain-containing protein [Aquimarina algicola]